MTAATINTSTPFSFAHEALASVTGSYNIAIPALPGHLVYYHVVTNGIPGPLQVGIAQ